VDDAVGLRADEEGDDLVAAGGRVVWLERRGGDRQLDRLLGLVAISGTVLRHAPGTGDGQDDEEREHGPPGVHDGRV
jgi:hypothetical protein